MMTGSSLPAFSSARMPPSGDVPLNTGLGWSAVLNRDARGALSNDRWCCAARLGGAQSVKCSSHCRLLRESGRAIARSKVELDLATSFDVCGDKSNEVFVAVIDGDVFDGIGGRFAGPSSLSRGSITLEARP